MDSKLGYLDSCNKKISKIFFQLLLLISCQNLMNSILLLLPIIFIGILLWYLFTIPPMKEHIMIEELKEGKRQPCCWPGCPHRRSSAQKWFKKIDI